MRESDPDGVVTLYGYNGQGELERTVSDLNQNGVIDDYGPDRITRMARGYQAAGGGKPDRVMTDTYAWVEDDTYGAVEKLISRSEVSTDRQHTWQTVWREAGNDGTAAVTETLTTFNSGTHDRTITVTAPDGTQTVTIYEYGLVRSVTRKDSSGAHNQTTRAEYAYDKYDRRTVVTDARNGATTYTLNDADQVLTATSPDAGSGPQITRTSYDNMGRATGSQNPDGTTTTKSYFPNGLLQKSWGAREYPVEYGYDAQGRLRTNKTWQTFVSNGGAAITRWNYDDYRGWLRSKDYPDPATGNPPSTEGTSGPVYTYTPGGRLASRSWHRLGSDATTGVRTDYTYGCNGNDPNNKCPDLVKVEYGNDPVHTPTVAYTYDRRGRRKTASQTDANQATVDAMTLAYDDANEQLGETHTAGILSGLSVAFEYNTALQRNALSLAGITGSYSASYGYDNAGRLSTVTEGNSVATYDYLANSPLVSQITYAQSSSTRMTTTKNYDRLNRLISISSLASGSAASPIPIGDTYAYNLANQRTRAVLPDGSYWIYTYDNLGQVTSGRRYWQDGTPVAGQQYEYAFDDIGNRKVSGVGGNASASGLRYATNTINRLNQYSERMVRGTNDLLGIANPTASVTVNGYTAYRKGEYFHYALPVDNSAAAQYQSVTIVSTFSPGDTKAGNVFTPQNPEAFGYDADGNLTSDGRWTYTWDGENRLVQMVARTAAGPQQLIKFDYDFQSRRIKKQVWDNVNGTGNPSLDQRFLYDGWNLLASLSPVSQLQSSFLWGTDLSGSMQEAGGIGGLLRVTYCGAQATNAFVAFDGNGNVFALIDAADGNYIGRYEYGPFGELIRATGPMAKANPFRFSTKYQDGESDLLYYGYRYYNPSTGRWNSRDCNGELGFEALRRGTWDLLGDGPCAYCFVQNDAVSRIDLLGSSCLDPCGLAKAMGLDRIGLPAGAESDASGVICCGGRKYTCIWRPGGQTGATNKRAQDIISNCLGSMRITTTMTSFVLRVRCGQHVSLSIFQLILGEQNAPHTLSTSSVYRKPWPAMPAAVTQRAIGS